MRTLRRKALAVFMAVLLGMASFAVLAEEPLESDNEEIVETVESVSNGDSVKYDKTSEEPDDVENEDIVDRDRELEELAEDQGIVYAVDDIASGVDGDITWVIDASGKLTVTGTGDFSGEHASENFAWKPYRNQIISAEINVSGMTDASYLFYGCLNMTSVNVSGLDTSSVTNMRSLFEDCRSLLYLDVSGWDTSNVTDMQCMFANCGLKRLNVNDLDTRSVVYMGSMFSRCTGLTELDVSALDTSNVTDMNAMFYGCYNLKRLNVNGLVTKNVTSMQLMFAGCSGLMSLDVSSLDTRNVINMCAMFSDCSSLVSLNVSGLATNNVTDMESIFYNCSSLTGLDISSFDTSSVLNMRQMFCGCSGLVSIDVSSLDTSNVTNMAHMFSGCSSLTSLDINELDTGNVTNMESLFQGCNSLTSLDLNDVHTSSVKYISGMFSGCSSLISLDISHLDTSSVTSMMYMFDECINLSTLHTPCNVNFSVGLPSIPGTTWYLPDGTEVTELPQGLSYSVTLTRSDAPTTPQITTTTDDLNMDDVIRVKYVPYSYTVVTDNTDEENTVTFSIAEGSLAEGLQMYPATGEIYGVPLEAGEFKVTVMATYSNPEYPPSYAELTLIVLDNTDDNVDVATDPGYDITQPVADFNMDAISGEGTQTLVSQGEYAQFQHIVYIDGKPLEEGEGKDYTSEEGSTRITILNQTLADGGEGTHTLGIEFRTEDGTLKRAAQNYTVSSGGSEDDGGNDTPVDEGNGEQDPGNESGDDIPSAGNIPENSGNDSNIGKADSSNKDSGIDVISIKKSLAEESIITVEYTVVSGDTLWSIAERFYGNGCLWTKIYEDNAGIIRDANKIYVGQVITIYLTEEQTTSSSSAADPEKSVTVDGETYVVQSGDSLWKIAVKFYDNGHQWRKIYEANQEVLRAPSKIYAGQVLVIPDR